MSRLGAATLAVLLLTVGLAGCLGMGGGDDGTTASSNATAQSVDGQPGASATESSGTGLQPVAFPAEAPLVHTIWANGTYSAEQSCLTGGCVTGDAFRQVELSSELAEETPVTVTAELTPSTSSIPRFDTIEVYMYSEDTTFYSYETTEDESREIDRATVLKGSAPLIVEVGYFGPTGQEPQFDYTLEITVENANTTLPPGVPVEVPLEPGEEISAQPADSADGGGSPGLLVYGPDDAFLTELGGDGGELQATVPDATSSGKHVVVVPEDSPPLELSTNATDTQLRALPLAYELGDPRSVQGPQAVEWSFEASQRPLAAGVYMATEQPIGVTALGGSATLSGPDGSVLETQLGCTLCITGPSFTNVETTDVGADGVTAGSYQAVYEPGVDVGQSVGQLTITYER